MAPRTPKQAAAKPASAQPAPRPAPGPDQFTQALREAKTLADLLSFNLGEPSSDGTSALAARGVPLVTNLDGEVSLYGSIRSPFAAEFLRLHAVVAEVLTPEVLAGYQARRDLRRARAAAEYLQGAAAQFVRTIDGLSDRAVDALDTNPDFQRVAGLWIDSARAIAQRAHPVTETTEA